MSGRYSTNNSDRYPWGGGFARPGRFGFEVVPDDSDICDDDELQSGRLVKTVLSIVVIALCIQVGSKLLDRAENFSWPKFERRVEDTVVEPKAQSPKIDESLLFPEASELAAKPEPETGPQRRLFNPDGTMKASFPLPPDGPPEEHYFPGLSEPEPANRKAAEPSRPRFDPEQEAVDPAEERSGRRTARASGLRKSSGPPRSIGEYEVFDPERDGVKSDWEFFDDPRR